MSYSFQVRGAGPSAAIAAASARLDEIVSQQPEHQADKGAILASIEGACRALESDASHDVVVSANGSVSWNGTPGQDHVRSVSLSLSVYLAERAELAS